MILNLIVFLLIALCVSYLVAFVSKEYDWNLLDGKFLWEGLKTFFVIIASWSFVQTVLDFAMKLTF